MLCQLCDIFISTEFLNIHIQKHEELPYFCKHCDKSFIIKKMYEEHFKSHDQIVCEMCKKVFRTQPSLKQHLAMHRGDFTCDHCKKSFTNTKNLKDHLMIHSGEKPYSCGECSMKFRQKSTLKRHGNFHTRNFPYSCENCNKGFSDRYHNERHKCKENEKRLIN